MKKEISNKNNYLSELITPLHEIVYNYNLLLGEYFELFKKNVKFANQIYLNKVFLKGLLTMNKVFNLVLLYTKNLELTYYCSQKSIIYYIEFIDQISEDANSFLQLNSQDAVLFVYKKTIYEIHEDFRKEFILECNKERAIYNAISLYTHMFEDICVYFVENDKNINEIGENLLKFKNKIPCTKKMTIDSIKNSSKVVNLIMISQLDSSKIWGVVVQSFKTSINLNTFKKKLYSEQFVSNSKTMTSAKLGQWLTLKE